jgi:hypothetical protein
MNEPEKPIQFPSFGDTAGKVFSHPDRAGKWASGILIPVVFCVLAAWTWRKWADVQIDYGMQLYLPWQLASGKVLFRDLAYLTGGPLSQYLHALAFKCFGVSFTTLIVVNLTLLALLLALLYWLFLRMADSWTALAVCLVTMCAFAFAQYLNIANYNYVCPYAYEAFHGLALSVAAIACWWRWFGERKSSWMFAAGLCAGGVFLTKPELFIAVAGALTVGGVIQGIGKPTTPCRAAWGLLFLGLSIPISAFAGYFSAVWNVIDGIKAAAGSWVPLLTTEVAKDHFYEQCLGLDRPVANVTLMLLRLVGLVLGVSILALACRRSQRDNPAVRLILGMLVVAMWLWSVSRFRWSQCGNALLPITSLGFLYLGWKWWKTRRTAEGQALALPLVWSAFSLLLLSKLGLLPRLWQYGAFLGMPAALFAVFALIRLLPREFERFRVDSIALRVITAVFILTAVVKLLWESNLYYRTKHFVVGSGADRMVCADPNIDGRAYCFQEAVSWIQANTSPSNTVAVLPEGVIINYLSRRTNPTPYALINPSEIQVHGDARMLDAYVKGSPDYIVLVHRDSSDWKVDYFGKETGYGHGLMRWVGTNYSTVWLLGNEPFQTNLFGVKLLKKNDL